MLDHVSLGVADLTRSRAFYAAVLGTLGIAEAYRHEPDWFGYATPNGHPHFWLTGPADGRYSTGSHVAFAAPSRAAVDAFHAAALSAGATCNGAPGLRPHYHADYYAAFVIEPDGHHLEAVCHHSEPTAS